MIIKDFQDSLDYLFKAQLTPFVWGKAGIGKSSVVKAYADKHGYWFFPFYLGTMNDTGDLLGLADFKKDENGNTVATQFATPIWLKEAIDYCEENPESGAVIFLDEFNRANRHILNGVFSLALDKTFHTIKLPKNCYIIAAGNPPTDEYNVTDVNETALMARFVHIKLEPTVDEWLAYANKKMVDHTLVSFIKEQPQLLEDAGSAFELPVKVDRRSFDRLNNLFTLKTPEHLLYQLMYGIIGVERTVAYQNHLKNSEKPLTGDEVVALDPVSLSKVLEWSKGDHIKSPLINITCDNLYDKVVNMSESKQKLTDAQKDNLLTFITSIPKEAAHNCIKRFIDKKVDIFFDFVTDKKYEKPLVSMLKAAKGIKE